MPESWQRTQNDISQQLTHAIYIVYLIKMSQTIVDLELSHLNTPFCIPCTVNVAELEKESPTYPWG